MSYLFGQKGTRKNGPTKGTIREVKNELTVSIQADSRQVRIVATNGTDERLAFVLNKDNIDNIDNNDTDNRRAVTYYEKNKPAMLEYSHNYYARNRQTILAKKKIYNEKNKERIAERHRHYYQSHKEQLRRQQRQYHNNKKPQIDEALNVIIQKL